MSRCLPIIASVLALALSSASPLLALQQDSTNAHVVIVVDSLDRAAFANVAELLQARVPGLHIARNGDGGMRWFMRGPASASESTPMVLIDDMRINMAGSARREIGTRPPLLDEVDIEEVERIEVWSGPASAVRHGAGAGNGVIRIVTFAPHAQKTSFRIATSASVLDENVTYPNNAFRARVDTAGAPPQRCTLQQEATGSCTPTGPPTLINVLESDSPFERAMATRVAAGIASGTERLAWRSGASFDREGSTSGKLAAQRIHVRGAAAFRPSETTSATVRAHWMRGDADLPAHSDLSLLRQGLFARADTAWRGFIEPRSPTYGSARYGITMNGGWRLGDWLTARVASGVEHFLDEDDLEYTEPIVSRVVDTRGERRRRDLTVRLDAEARYGAGTSRHTTSLTIERGVSRQEEEFSAGSAGLPAYAFWLNQRTGIAGAGLLQRLDLADIVSLAAGLRIDQLKSGDVRWDAPLSPHLSVSWNVRPFVPGALGGVRLRAALADVAGIPQTTWLAFTLTPGGFEPPKAEVTRERELALDVMAAHDRVGLSVSGYTKRTSNVVNVNANFFPPGPISLHRIEVLNRGLEATLRARLVQAARVSWDVRARYAHNHNEVTDGGGQSLVDDGEPQFLNPQWVSPGHPLGAHRSFPFRTLQDFDGDGLIDDACTEPSTCEAVISASPQFRPAYPPTSASLETSFRFAALALSVLIDHRSGHVMNNATRARRCVSLCQALFDPTTSLRDQAKAIVASGFPAPNVEDASFTKLREVSLRIEAPASWARAVGGTRLNLSVAGRNVATWTDYSGLDPEATSLPWIPLANVDNLAAPLPRRVIVRADLHGR